MNYFNKLPSINYDGYVSKNLLARAKIPDKVKNQKSIFYEYTHDAEERVDNLSNYYYGNPGYTWLVWLSNDIIDPYYDVALSEQDLYNSIQSKYGSLEKAQRKITYYRVNWREDVTVKTPSEFEALSSQFKKYWEPVVIANYVVQSYVRKPETNICKTNKILTLEVTGQTGTFTQGEEVRINSTNYGFFLNGNTSVLSLNNIQGSITQSSTITGQESGAQATVASVTTTAETIASTDSAYWEPVSFYTYEVELNDSKKNMKLVDSRYRGQVENELKRIMSIR